MNFPLIFGLLGYVYRCEAVLLLLPLLTGVIYGEWDQVKVFAGVALLLVVVSELHIVGGRQLQKRAERSRPMQARDGLFAVALSWIGLALFGALPYFFSGYFSSFTDCLFEAISGFTTTGSTILEDIESLPRSTLLWRSFTQWIGGMGVLVFILGLMPNLDASGIQLLRAESPGPVKGKLSPRMLKSSRTLYGIYIGMTLLLIGLLSISGLPFYDAIINAISTAGTGGFCSMNASVAAYDNPVAEMILAVFMILFGVNFSVHYAVLRRQWGTVKENEEWKVYFAIIAVSTLLITINISSMMGDSLLQSFRYAFYQVATVITTTGSGTADFNLWPSFSKMLLLLLMLIGACGGSTGGGIKISRIIILFKSLLRERAQLLHPNLVKSVRVDGRVVEEKTVRNVLIFFFAYLALILVASFLIAMDGFDLETTVTAVMTAVGNVGPGLGLVGPTGNFAAFSAFSKLVLSFCMLVGRLEILPFLVLLTPAAWRSGN